MGRLGEYHSYLYMEEQRCKTLLQLIQDMWGKGTVVGDWRDAVVVPIPKKGDLKLNKWNAVFL